MQSYNLRLIRKEKQSQQDKNHFKFTLLPKMMFDRIPYKRDMDDGAVSDDEENFASFGFRNMKLAI